MTLDQMGVNEWLIIGAALIGPVLAVQAQKWVERLKTESNRRAWIFETLMTTRSTRLAIDHVRALNAIDLAFYGRRMLGMVKRDKNAQAVIDRWRAYHSHLSKPEASSPEDFARWVSTGDELFLDLLAALAKASNYQFDRFLLKGGAYTPTGYWTAESEQQEVRKGLMQIVTGKKAFPIEIRRFSERSKSFL